MSDWSHDLLSEPIIGVRHDNGDAVRVSLPALLARLSSGAPTEYTALQAHQKYPWHSFLVQLAAIALHRTSEATPPEDEGRWSEMLLDLTGGAREPWCLVVEDLSKPAFMQPAVPEGELEGFKSGSAVTDGSETDILLTARNHDVKEGRVVHAKTDHWIFALVALQTQQGYSGSKKYGIARMNAGTSNRPHVAYAPSLDWGTRFRRDVDVLLGQRSELIDRFGYRVEGGHHLVWLIPWTGETSLSLCDCDPFFVEVCRRVRLCQVDGCLVTFTAPSECARIEASDAKGNTGDPWTPVSAGDGKSLTVGSSGFSYRLVAKLLLTGEYHRPGAAVLRSADGEDPLFVASALTRGQGKTRGFHERVLPIPRKARRLLSSLSDCDRISSIALSRVEAVSKLRKHVLKPALCALMQGAPSKLDLRDDRPRRFLDSLEREVDRVFFDRLWEDVGLDRAESEHRWAVFLVDLAGHKLQEAIANAPIPSARRYQAIAVAESLLHGASRKHLPEALSRKEEPVP